MYVEHIYETSSHNQNEQVQYVYHCCLCLISDQNGIALHNSHATYMMNTQTQQNQQLERMMREQQRYTAALSLPQPEVPIFKGQPIEYCSFVLAFENLIESKIDSSSSRLY